MAYPPIGYVVGNQHPDVSIVRTESGKAAATPSPPPAPPSGRPAAAGAALRRAGLALLALAAVVHAQPAVEPATASGNGRSAAATVTALPQVVVSAARAPVPVAELAVAVDLFSPARLQASPGRPVDAVLRESPAFSLFRRSGSLVANPTAQGVSLRGVGPSGASRSLVLLDGVPLNDPFGGWVAWGKVPTLALAGAEILRGGGSAEWGNAALGGTIALFTEPTFSAEGDSGATAAASAGRLRLSGGSAGTVEGEAYARTPVGQTAVIHTSVSALTARGDFTLAPAQRGTVDRRLDLRQRLLQGTWRQRLGSATPVALAVTLRAFDEDRGNGTTLQRNASSEQFTSVALSGHPSSALAWTANLYAQRQEFSSVFTSVDAARRLETPANDQFAVPSNAGGANVTVALRHPGAARASSAVGADVRVVRGETREDFLWSGTRFTRRRFAGGTQRFVGLFASHERTIGERLRASAALRLDRWANTDGHRREWDSATAASTRDDRFADRSGTSLNPRIGVTLPLGGARPVSTAGAPESAPARLRAAAYQAFRLPTLNEFHRPFRVGNVNTEANPLLAPERLTGFETGLDLPLGAGRMSVTAFRQDLRDAVANVTLSRTPTLVSRQRRNLEAVRVDGLEAGFQWAPSPRWSGRVDVLFSDATVRTAAAQPALAGRRLAQVPRFVGTAGMTWRDARLGTLDVRLRHSSVQYEDDENLLPLEPATSVDVQWSRSLARWLEGFITVENATQSSLQTGRTVDGLISLDAPRRFRLGLRSQW